MTSIEATLTNAKRNLASIIVESINKKKNIENKKLNRHEWVKRQRNFISPFLFQPKKDEHIVRDFDHCHRPYFVLEFYCITLYASYIFDAKQTGKSKCDHFNFECFVKIESLYDCSQYDNCMTSMRNKTLHERYS